MPSVVIPAHNEERVIGRLLSALLNDGSPGDAGTESVPPDGLEIVVVANGCSDSTAEVASGYRGVRVVRTPVASKSAALRLGDETATSFPRLYVDADVVLGLADLDELCRALAAPGVRAAGPERVLPMDGVATLVRWYYDVWQRLPAVREELFGRGAVAVNEDGHERLASFLTGGVQVMSDDLAMAMSFGSDERIVVGDSYVEIRPPRTYADLMRRRVRAMTGNAQLATDAGSAQENRRAAPRTGVRELAGLVAREPGLLRKVVLVLKIGVFMGTAVVSRARARRAADKGDATWLRDESSRT